jgi:hypothetical protein
MLRISTKQNLVKFSKFIFKEMKSWHRGNAFSQAQHDGGSRHGMKYQVLATQGVPHGLDKNLVLCLMHDMDKPQASAIGKLVRSSKRVLVNPFPEGVALWRKAHALAVHFSYSNRLSILHGHCAAVKCAAIKVQVDSGDARVAEQHGLFLSLIRMMPALVLYLSQYTGENAADMDLTKEEWKDLIVQESVLDTV